MFFFSYPYFVALKATNEYGGMGASPCVICPVPIDQLRDHLPSGLSGFLHRTPEVYLDILNSGKGEDWILRELKKLSLFPEMSALFSIRHPNIYMAYAVDILHMLDVGLSKDIWEQVIRWIHGVPMKKVGLHPVETDGPELMEAEKFDEKQERWI